MLKRIDVVKILSLIMWGIAIFAYFFQFPIKSLSSLIIPCLGVYLVCKLKDLQFDKKTLFLLISFLIFLTFSTAISLVDGTGITRIIRFLFILIAILFCSFVHNDDMRVETDMFIILAVIKSLLLVAIAVTIVLVGEYAFIRNWSKMN
ncbi:MAG: hypothetical protein J6I97_03085, partial [Agathobacter sp.]|nr:hypothetical protein [Agathobacter sp.]